MAGRASQRSVGRMDIESAPGAEQGGFTIFPLDLCCITPFLKACFPSTITNIQDCTHLSMSVGVLCGWALLIWAIYEVIYKAVFGLLPIPFIRYSGGGQCIVDEEQLYCAPHILVFFLAPSIFYWWGLLKQYDQEIMSKKAQLEDLQRENQELFSTTIKEMEGVLENQVENNSGLAEKSFDSKKRDFLRFVKAAKQKYQHFFSGSKGEIKQLTDEFRTFVKQWLIIFEEASVDPVNRPIQLAGDNQVDLDSLATLGDIADWVIAKLGATKVNFISNAMKDDQKIIAQGKAEERRIHDKMIEGKYGLIMVQDVTLDGNVTRICFEEWKQITMTAKRHRESGNTNAVALMEGGGFGKRVSLTGDEPGEVVDKSKCTACACTWWRCTTARVNVKDDPSNSGSFPCACYMGCVTVIFLSREHVWLVVGLPVSIGAILLHLFMPVHNYILMALFAVCIWSLVVVLIRFEQIDEVMRLDAEVKDLQRRADAIQGKKQRMNEFWKEVQNIADLWLHRTVPRLEVVKEAHGHLEDAKPEQLLMLLTQTNKALQNLEIAVGPRQLWLKDGGITEDEKKKFGETIYALSNNVDLPKVLDGLNKATKMIEGAKRNSLVRAEDAALLKGLTTGTDTAPYALG